MSTGEILPHEQIRALPDHSRSLADLTRVAWTGRDGRCYFPYAPLTRPAYWENHMAQQWIEGSMHSWALHHEGRLVAHAALVRKGENTWELGRWVAYREAPRGSVTRLCEEAMRFATDRGWRVRVECTQAHIFSQRICEHLGMRPAGYGFLDQIDGIAWDIIYYDNDPRLSHFDPRDYDDVHVIGNPLGVLVRVDPNHRGRVQEILGGLITCNPGGDIPPTRFHILPHRVDPLRRSLERALANSSD